MIAQSRLITTRRTAIHDEMRALAANHAPRARVLPGLPSYDCAAVLRFEIARAEYHGADLEKSPGDREHAAPVNCGCFPADVAFVVCASAEMRFRAKFIQRSFRLRQPSAACGSICQPTSPTDPPSIQPATRITKLTVPQTQLAKP